MTGWVRVNFNYFISDVVFEYLLDAICLIGQYGWALLPQYTFEPSTCMWRHRAHCSADVSSLFDVTFDSGRLEFPSFHATQPERVLPGYLDDARAVLEAAVSCTEPIELPPPVLGADFESLRWFPLPQDAMDKPCGHALTGHR